MQLNLILPTLADGNVYHVYCSIYNEGAEQLFQEAMHVCGKAWHMSDVQVCTDRAHLAKCNCFILYLNTRTWSNGTLSKDMLEGELEEAMEAGVQLCLAHEMPMFAYPGSSWDQINPVDGEMLTASSRTRHACDFGDFFVLTPKRLLEQKLYNTIATPLKGGQWRAVSLKIFAKQLYGLLGSAPVVEELPLSGMEQLAREENSHLVKSRRLDSRLAFSSTTLNRFTPHLRAYLSRRQSKRASLPSFRQAGAMLRAERVVTKWHGRCQRHDRVLPPELPPVASASVLGSWQAEGELAETIDFMASIYDEAIVDAETPPIEDTVEQHGTWAQSRPSSRPSGEQPCITIMPRSQASLGDEAGGSLPNSLLEVKDTSLLEVEDIRGPEQLQVHGHELATTPQGGAYTHSREPACRRLRSQSQTPPAASMLERAAAERVAMGASHSRCTCTTENKQPDLPATLRELIKSTNFVPPAQPMRSPPPVPPIDMSNTKSRRRSAGKEARPVAQHVDGQALPEDGRGVQT